MVENFREPEDLLSDESFLSWYFKTGVGENTAWEQWMASSPEHKALVSQAVELLNKTRLREREISLSQQQRAEAALMAKIIALPATRAAASYPDPHMAESRAAASHPDQYIPGTAHIDLPTDQQPDQFITEGRTSEDGIPATRVIPIYRDRRWIAAACILVALTTGLYLTRYLKPSGQQVVTAYGQIKQQQLPDGTEVIMNANSRLTYSSGWQVGADREVWVTGEAYFHVRRTPEKSRFIVHTDHFDVIVTGTQFNVVNRHGKANVMLQEGSVTLHMKDGREIKMAPGDFVAWDSDQPEKRPAKNDSLLAWKEQKLVFNKTPLQDLATIINEQYGVPVKLSIECPHMGTVSGIMPNNNLDVLLQALVATSEFDVIRTPGNDTITIKAYCQQN